MKNTLPPEQELNPSHWHDETCVLHGHVGLSTDSALVAPIHYSATFKASDPKTFAEMANVPRHPGFYTRYGNPTHERVAAILAKLAASLASKLNQLHSRTNRAGPK